MSLTQSISEIVEDYHDIYSVSDNGYKDNACYTNKQLPITPFTGFFATQQQMLLYEDDPTIAQIEMDESIVADETKKCKPAPSIGYSSSDNHSIKHNMQYFSEEHLSPSRNKQHLNTLNQKHIPLYKHPNNSPRSHYSAYSQSNDYYITSKHHRYSHGTHEDDTNDENITNGDDISESSLMFKFDDNDDDETISQLSTITKYRPRIQVLPQSVGSHTLQIQIPQILNESLPDTPISALSSNNSPIHKKKNKKKHTKTDTKISKKRDKKKRDKKRGRTMNKKSDINTAKHYKHHKEAKHDKQHKHHHHKHYKQTKSQNDIILPMPQLQRTNTNSSVSLSEPRPFFIKRGPVTNPEYNKNNPFSKQFVDPYSPDSPYYEWFANTYPVTRYYLESIKNNKKEEDNPFDAVDGHQYSIGFSDSKSRRTKNKDDMIQKDEYKTKYKTKTKTKYKKSRHYKRKRDEQRYIENVDI